MYDNKKQLYGTQYRMGPDGKSEIYPIDDIAQLDQRRLSMGLSTFAYYLNLTKRWSETPSPAPTSGGAPSK